MMSGSGRSFAGNYLKAFRLSPEGGHPIVTARSEQRVQDARRFALTAFRRREVICPSCHCVAGNFTCDVGQIRSSFPRIPCPHEGRIAIVTDVGHRMRWTRMAHETNAPAAYDKAAWS